MIEKMAFSLQNYIQNRRNMIGRTRSKTIKERKGLQVSTVIYPQLLSALVH